MPETNRIPGPSYITKFLHVDQRFADEFTHLDASLIPANIALWRPNLTPSVGNGCRTLLVDPMTHAFTYRGFLEKSTFIALPYAPAEPLSASILLSDPEALSKFTRQVLEFQCQMDADVLLAPYFYARDMDDARLTASLRMISEAARLRDELHSDMPLYAWICIGSIVMHSPTQVNEIRRLYSGQPIEGLMVTVENFDDRYVSAESLMGLTRLILRLSDEYDVFSCSIASFGQVLTALGANGFSAGIGWLETFREVTLQPGRPIFAADRTPRAQYYYVPELLSYVHPDAHRTIFDEDTGSSTMRDQYRCGCTVCANGRPETPEEKKRHFMIRRQQEMTELASVSPEKRPQYMRERLELALELANIIEEEALVRIPTEHFVRWIAVIDALVSASRAEAGNDSLSDLDRIIHETR